MDIECVSTSFAVKFTVIAMGILEYSLFYKDNFRNNVTIT